MSSVFIVQNVRSTFLTRRAPASGAKYAIDTKITRAVEDFGKRFEHRLFLSATPHNGHSNSFSRLLELLDPQRFCRGVTPEPDSLEQVIVRRLKGDMRGRWLTSL